MSASASETGHSRWRWASVRGPRAGTGGGCGRADDERGARHHAGTSELWRPRGVGGGSLPGIVRQGNPLHTTPNTGTPNTVSRARLAGWGRGGLTPLPEPVPKGAGVTTNGTRCGGPTRLPAAPAPQLLGASLVKTRCPVYGRPLETGVRLVAHRVRATAWPPGGYCTFFQASERPARGATARRGRSS